MSGEPRSKYRLPPKALRLAEKLADTKRGMKVSAMWHSHPTPCIMSVADVAYAESDCKDIYFVMISPKETWGKNFVWYACKGIKPEEINFVK